MKRWMFIIILLILSCSQDKPPFEAPIVYYNNVPVMYEKSSQQTDYVAIHDRIGAGIGIFYWNELTWNDFSPNMKFFAFFHEICHLNIPTENEYEADCCALKLMKASCMLSDKEVIEILELFSNNNSVERQIEILSCFDKLE